MPDIHIHRDHHLGFAKARKIAFTWAEQAEQKFDMECVYEEGDHEDTLHFSRTGVKGTLLVDAHRFEMHAQLGFLLGAFKDRIEAEISEQLDALLGPAEAKAQAAHHAHAAHAPAAPRKAAAKPAAEPAPARKTSARSKPAKD